MRQHKKQKGFTLIETMITVSIAAIVASIAVPTYNKHLLKTRRSDAKVGLLKIAQMQESYFAQNLSYARNFTQGPGGLGLTAAPIAVPTENNYYNMAIQRIPAACNGTAANPCTGFMIRAAPQGVQLNDAKCAAFMITNTGQKRVSADGGSVARSRECWR